MRQSDFPLVALVGAAFAGALRMEIQGDETWGEMRDANREYSHALDPATRGCCASHNYCDANMSMLAGFQAVVGRDPVLGDGPGSEEDMELMNAAWDFAKAAFLTSAP